MTCQIRSGEKSRKSVRSRQDLSNEYLLAKMGVDTAENGPLKVCQKYPKVRKKVRINIGDQAPAERGRMGREEDSERPVLLDCPLSDP